MNDPGQLQARTQSFAALVRRLFADREDIPADVVAGMEAIAVELEKGVYSPPDLTLRDTAGNISEDINRPGAGSRDARLAAAEAGEEVEGEVENLGTPMVREIHGEAAENDGNPDNAQGDAHRVEDNDSDKQQNETVNRDEVDNDNPTPGVFPTA